MLKMTSRAVDSGDYAIIEVASPACTYKYIIRKITAEGIYIAPDNETECSLLINTMKGWQVYKYSNSHTVTFKAKPVENTIAPLDLVFMNYYTLIHRAKLNPQIEEICQDDDFWYQKLIHDYGLKVARHKPVHETYKQQYEYLHYTSALERGLHPRIDGLICNLEMGYTLSTVSANQALAENNTEVLKWLEQRGIYPTQSPPEKVIDISKEVDAISEEIACTPTAESNSKASVISGLLNWWYQK